MSLYFNFQLLQSSKNTCKHRQNKGNNHIYHFSLGKKKTFMGQLKGTSWGLGFPINNIHVTRMLKVVLMGYNYRSETCTTYRERKKKRQLQGDLKFMKNIKINCSNNIIEGFNSHYMDLSTIYRQ